MKTQNREAGACDPTVPGRRVQQHGISPLPGRIHYLNAMGKLCIQRFGKSGPLVPGQRTRLKKGLDGDLEQIIQLRERLLRERQQE
jgi:hypothetical protein